MDIPQRARLTLTDALKTHTRDQDKVMAPAETARRFRERLAALDLDILKTTTRIDNGRLGIPVFFSLCGADAAAVTGTRKQMGKGATPEQAEASAVMELAERFSFFSFNRDPANFITGTWADFSEHALPLDSIARSVHDAGPDLDQGLAIFKTLPMRWTWGFSLTRREPALIPFDWFFAINAFNGPSAGNCREEALIQGICEVVERHVCALVSRGRLETPAIRPETVTDPAAKEMLEKYAAAGIRLWLSDMTLGMGIPTVGALAHDPATFPESSELVWTAGTAPSPEKALSRALSETAQLGGDFNTGANYVASGLPKPADLADAAFITRVTPSADVAALPDISDANIRVEIERAVAALAGRGLEALTIETTHPRLGVPAFYTLIPGAHFRERAAATSVAMFCAKLMAENRPPREAIGRLTEMDRLIPNRYWNQFYLGNLRLSMDDPETALIHMEKALNLNPDPQDAPAIHSYMGVCLKELKRYDDALATLEKGAALDPERTDIWNLMGFCHFKKKDHRAAIDCFEKVLEIDPGSAIDYANIGVNYRDLGEREHAIEYFLKALTIDPSIEFARENLDRLMKGR